MGTDFAHLPTGESGWSALIDHACRLGDLSEVDWFELKGRLPFGSRSDRKRSAVVVARAIIGLANRMPDAAARNLSGFGVVLVGVADGEVSGAEEIDGADLGNALEPFVTQDGLRWDHLYVRHARGLVLAVIVDPPKWGNPIFHVQKAYSSADGGTVVRDGEVLVRVPGKTRPATGSDLRDLQRRMLASPSAGASLSVACSGGFHRVVTESARELVGAHIDDVVGSRLADVPREPSAKNPFIGTSVVASLSAYGSGDTAGYRSRVASWRSAAEALVPEVAEEFLRHTLATERLSISNTSDRFLEGVQVRISVPTQLRVLIRSDTDYCEHGGPFNFVSMLPDRPPKWDAFRMPGLYDGWGPDMSGRAPAMANLGDMVLRNVEAGAEIVWSVGDLRPESTAESEDQFALITDLHGDRARLNWEVTARAVNRVFKGETVVECAQEPGVHLRWRSSRT